MSQALPNRKAGATLTREQQRFREFIGKVGSGEHTSTGLSREEAREAMDLMLSGQASAAQIGAFFIAHRIRRPAPEELTGMLDSYRSHGPQLLTPGRRAICFGVPYDGRTRTAPLLPLVALVLASAGLPVVLHGGNPMPVKYGVTLAELFAALGLNWGDQTLATVQLCLDRHNLGVTHQPIHFGAAESLVSVRDAIGKRPPVASLELLWTPHQGEHLLVSGFVHPPTETRAWQALNLAGEHNVLTVKGLEGSTDIPISRACITGRPSTAGDGRMILHPRDHGCYGADPAWEGIEAWISQALAALGGQGDLATALIWNAGTYLWQAGACGSLEEGLSHCSELLETGTTLRHLNAMRQDTIGSTRHRTTHQLANP